MTLLNWIEVIVSFVFLWGMGKGERENRERKLRHQRAQAIRDQNTIDRHERMK